MDPNVSATKEFRSSTQAKWLPGFAPGEDKVHTHSISHEPASRGLMVRDPYASQLLNGEKTWEIRGRATQIRGTIVIIKSGTGAAFGTVELVRVVGPLNLEDLIHSPHLSQSEREEFEHSGLPYAKTFAYEVTNAKWFATPISYKHPYGAVTWVNLDSLNPNEAQYASRSTLSGQSALA